MPKMENFLKQLISDNTSLNSPLASIVIALILLWSLTAKGTALWHAAQNKERNWFIAILILNTVGIIEIIYLFFFSKKKLTTGDMTRYFNSLKSKINL